MAKFRNVSGEARVVGYGCPRRSVDPDDVVTVLAPAAISYAGQEAIWEPVDDEAHDAVGEYAGALSLFAEPGPTGAPATRRRVSTPPPSDPPLPPAAADGDKKETDQ